MLMAVSNVLVGGETVQIKIKNKQKSRNWVFKTSVDFPTAHVLVCIQATHSTTDPSTSTRHVSAHYLHACTMISVELSESNLLEVAVLCV